ncbi:hypothetical protein DPEC_G00239790 [Dallia pectoralis]|uniref:Uncharacterized protein n=1 Tax=Dallia pectoralis TaxID=75939 RepID=A0ACC2FZM9_DALPE|nr:hypothetical protein DPEC_G00239790 [Dallia pectoralis]
MIKAFAQTCGLLLILTSANCQIPDAHVTCQFSRDCVLPCTFKPNGNVNVMWYRQDVLIFSQNQDGLQSNLTPQNQSPRMHVLQDQLARGSASLHLNMCDIKDRGRYRCLVNNTLSQQESFVIVKVEAAIKMVTLETGSNREVLCLCKDIYPAPRVQWSTVPIENSLMPSTQIFPNAQGLYSVQSKLRMSENILTYICTVNSMYGTQSWRSTLQQKELIGKVGRELSIPCIAPQNLQNFTLTWTFTRTNKSSNILSYDSRTRHTSNNWLGQAGLEQHRVLLGNGSLLLKHPETQENTGTYTCTFSGLQNRHVVQTQVHIRSKIEGTPSSGNQSGRSGQSTSKLWPIAVVVAVAMVATVAALLLYKKRKANQRRSNEIAMETTETKPMKTLQSAEELPVDNC